MLSGWVPSEGRDKALFQASPLASGSLLAIPGVPGAEKPRPISAFIFTWHSPCVCASVSKVLPPPPPAFFKNKDTSHIELGAQLLLILTNFICNEPISK